MSIKKAFKNYAFIVVWGTDLGFFFKMCEKSEDFLSNTEEKQRRAEGAV
jgi:hypothetical protein